MIDYGNTYHIYLNNTCIKCNLGESEFKNEMTCLNTFLELTNLTESAKLEYVVCDPPHYESNLGEPSF